MAEDWQAGGFGLYLHWPYCEAKCPYCDFNSHVARQIDQGAWCNAYLAEIDRYAQLLPGRVLNSVFFGGGTPSLMDPDSVHQIIARIRQSWPTANDLEITLEANPSSVEAGRFRAYQQAGVSRISMGIQALNEPDLKRLGRIHTVDEAKQAFQIARSTFDRVSFDLIYARQDQTLDSWKSELKSAVNMTVDHLSLYQLTIEPGTAFGDRFENGRLKGLPKDSLSADMYDATQEICDAAGMSAYEVSNHAQSGSESRHNLIYWRYGDYIGIGPGAHGRITLNGVRHATVTYAMPDRWLKAAMIGATEKEFTPLSAIEQAGEYLLMGLRVSEGIDYKRYSLLLGKEPDRDVLEHLVTIGMIEPDLSKIRATRNGRLVLNSVIEELLPDPGV
ncbi:MAG: radical SAM family heme chaperone HemW [Roseovarius sp.]